MADDQLDGGAALDRDVQHYDLCNGNLVKVQLPQTVGAAADWGVVSAAGINTCALKTTGELCATIVVG